MSNKGTLENSIVNLNKAESDLIIADAELKETKLKFKDVLMEQKVELKNTGVEKSNNRNEFRITCPKCQAVGKSIRKVDDREKILSYHGNIPMYAKKYICKTCGHEWK